VRQTSVCRQGFDKLMLVGHQTAPDLLEWLSLADSHRKYIIEVFRFSGHHTSHSNCSVLPRKQASLNGLS
ncbi:MAG TPA: hypothetical protein VFH31_08670, partial [Pyrinomonadaceae bacterium]|nr:hypothetical protein [Pyrinomonadaceae bacterium]